MECNVLIVVVMIEIEVFGSRSLGVACNLVKRLVCRLTASIVILAASGVYRSELITGILIHLFKTERYSVCCVP